jgi:predicted TIM-barrel fold metal-dependent hydrolase
MALERRPAWLKQTYEEPLERGLPICDTHHHFWDHGPADRYLLPELLEDVAGGHNVVSTVFVECGSGYRTDGAPELQPVGETELVEGIAAGHEAGGPAMTRAAAGIVSYADLMLGDRVAEVLEAHLEASPRRFRGIRYWLTWDEHPQEVQLRTTAPRGLAYERKFREGYACLERYGLSYDAWMLFHQLPDAVDLARSFPGITMIVEHFGGLVGVGAYADRDQVFALWKRNIAEVARCPNVVVKLGGVGMPRLGFGWHEREKPLSSMELAQAFAPYFSYCIEQFGPARCMFESNSPVDQVSASYNVLWNAFKRITERYSPAERQEMFYGTAARVYRLDGAS